MTRFHIYNIYWIDEEKGIRMIDDLPYFCMHRVILFEEAFSSLMLT